MAVPGPVQFIVKPLAVIANALARLVLFALAAIFALFIICFALLGMAIALIRAVLTGRKPEFVTTFVRFQQASQQFKRTDANHRHTTDEGFASSGDVIEGQAVEIRDDQALPHQPSATKDSQAQ